MRQAILLSGVTLAPLTADFAPHPLNLIGLQEHGLRWYQEALALEIARLFSIGFRRILVVLPTGGGKTRLAQALMDATRRSDLTAQFLVHRRELIKQTDKSFREAGIFSDLIVSGSKTIGTSPYQIASVQTLVNRLDIILPPGLAIIDEAHHATASSWANIMRAYGDRCMVGLTATPQRLDGRPLGDMFDCMLIGPSTADLIEWGFLSPFDYYAPGPEGLPDASGIRTIAGDLDKAETARRMDKPELVGSVVDHYKRLGDGMQGIIFASSVKHSLHLTDAFNRAGIRAVHADGTMDDERDRAIDSYATEKARILCNVGLVSEGFDVPNTKYVGMARISNSLIFNWQASGRALRLSPVWPRAVICDHGGNALRTGVLPDSEIEWSLSAPAKHADAVKSVDNPVWQCEHCYRINYSLTRVCAGCGYEKPVQSRSVSEKDGTLTRLEKEELKRRERAKQVQEEGMCRDYADFYHLAVARGYKNPVGWAKLRSKLRGKRRG